MLLPETIGLKHSAFKAPLHDELIISLQAWLVLTMSFTITATMILTVVAAAAVPLFQMPDPAQCFQAFSCSERKAKEVGDMKKQLSSQISTSTCKHLPTRYNDNCLL